VDADADITTDYSLTGMAAQYGLDLTDPDTRYALAELYGDGCPLLFDNPTEQDWCGWGPALWGRHESPMQPILHRAEKLRNFRDGNQWISSRGYGMWYVPPKPSGMVRVVDNMMAPAMDYRVEIVAEQRPGFKTKPENQDQRTLKRAEAQQAGVEYQFDQQKIPRVQREAEYWAQTDGVAFIESFWDPDRGPWDEIAVEKPSGVQQMRAPLGDLNTVVHRIDEVRVSSNATATIRPNYMIIKKTRPLAKAIAEFGKDVATSTLSHSTSEIRTMQSNRLINPQIPVDQLLENQAKVDEYTIYIEKSALLPQGLQLKCVGDKCVIPPQPLLYGRIPVARWTDGSTDPSYFPKPVAYEWCDTQQRINACESKLIESIRLNAGEKLIAKRETLSSETLSAGNMTIFEFKGGGNLRDSIQALPSTSVGDDVKVGLEMWIKRFEQLTGYNDQARGSADPGRLRPRDPRQPRSVGETIRALRQRRSRSDGGVGRDTVRDHGLWLRRAADGRGLGLEPSGSRARNKGSGLRRRRAGDGRRGNADAATARAQALSARRYVPEGTHLRAGIPPALALRFHRQPRIARHRSLRTRETLGRSDQTDGTAQSAAVPDPLDGQLRDPSGSVGARAHSAGRRRTRCCATPPTSGGRCTG
jgi:hypothetical protein